MEKLETEQKDLMQEYSENRFGPYEKMSEEEVTVEFFSELLCLTMNQVQSNVRLTSLCMAYLGRQIEKIKKEEAKKTDGSSTSSTKAESLKIIDFNRILRANGLILKYNYFKRIDDEFSRLKREKSDLIIVHPTGGCEFNLKNLKMAPKLKLQNIIQDITLEEFVVPLAPEEVTEAKIVKDFSNVPIKNLEMNLIVKNIVKKFLFRKFILVDLHYFCIIYFHLQHKSPKLISRRWKR